MSEEKAKDSSESNKNYDTIGSFEIQTDNNKSSTESVNYRPIYYFLSSILVAWIYVIIPNNGYWTYMFIKCQYWSFWGLVAFVEMQDLCLPNTSNMIYVLSYAISFWVPPLVHFMAYICNIRNNFYLNSFAVTSAVVPVIIFYGIEVFCLTDHTDKQSHSQNNINTLSMSDNSTTKRTNGDNNKIPVKSCQLYDTFSAALLFELPSQSRSYSTHTRSDTISALYSTDSNDKQNDADTENNGIMDSELKLLWILENKRQQTLQTTNSRNLTTSQQSQSQEVESISTGTIWDIIALQYLPRRLRNNPLLNTTNSVTPRQSHETSTTDTDSISQSQRSINTQHNRYKLQKQWVYASLYNLFFNNYYYFLIWFTNYFRSNAHSEFTRVILFFMFVTIGSLFRGLLKRLGLLIDRNKMYSASMYFLAEIMCLLFYYTFYRVLFESVTSWALFIVFQLIHLGSEWLLYPLRATKLFYNITQCLNDNNNTNTNSCLKCARSLLSMISTGGLQHRDWQCFIGLDFGLRCVVLSLSGFGISLLLVTVAYFPYVENSLQESTPKLLLTLAFILIATVLEVVNAYIMNLVYFQRIQLKIYVIVQHCLKNKRFLFLSAILAAVLFINPMAAFETKDQF